MQGADTAALRDLAHRMEAEAEELAGALRSLDRRLESTWWQGPQADRFRRDWTATHAVRMRRAIARLEDTAAELRAQAARQDRTSR